MDPKLAKVIAKAIEELAELASGVEKEDEHYEIAGFEVGRTAFMPNNWYVGAILVDGSYYKYAVYIDPDTYQAETDGF